MFGHGWVYFKGERMSKSLGNIVDPLDAADRFGPDPLRLYLTKEIPYGADGDFSWERFEEKYNADLANNLGNLVSRVSAMTERYRDGRLKASSGGALARVAAESVRAYREAMNEHALHDGVAAAFRLVSAANEFIAETQPWSLAKKADDPATTRLGVYTTSPRRFALPQSCSSPVIPSSATEILRRLGESRQVGELRLDDDTAWRASGERQVLNAGALWPRIEDKGAVTLTSDASNPSAPVAPAAPARPSRRLLKTRSRSTTS